MSTKSSTQSKATRRQKKQKIVPYFQRKQLGSGKEQAPSAGVIKKYKVLKEITDLFTEMREILESNQKQNLPATSKIAEMKHSENCSSKNEWHQVGELASGTTQPGAKRGGKHSAVCGCAEGLALRRRGMDEVKSRLDEVKQYGSRYKELQGYKVSESNAGSRCRNYNIRTKDEGKESTNSEDVEEERNMQTFRNEKILTACREEKVYDEGAILTLTADLSSATLGINRQWGNIFKILTDNDFEPKFVCDVKLSLKCDGETKTFSNLESLREFTSQKPCMKELLQDVLPQDEKTYRGRRYGIQEKLRKGLIGSKHGTGEPTNDGLSFLFIKEVKIDKPEASSELEEEEEEQDASWIEEEEWEDASWLDVEEEEEREEEEEEESSAEEREETVRSSGLKKTEKCRILKLEELTAKEADLIQETEENFRKNVIHFFREIQEEIGNVKSFYPEILEIKNSIHDLDNVMDTLEERMDSLEDQILEFSKDAMQMAKQMINEERSRDTEDRSRSANIRLIGVPEKDNKDNKADDIVREVIEENFPELKKESRFEIISAHRIPSRIDENRLTPRHILVRFWNASDKEKIMIASKGKKEIIHRGARIRLTADLSLSTLDARSKWAKIMKVLHEQGFRPRILYPAKLAFDFQGRTKMFYDIEEFRAFISSVPPLKKLLENVLVMQSDAKTLHVPFQDGQPMAC